MEKLPEVPQINSSMISHPVSTQIEYSKPVKSKTTA